MGDRRYPDRPYVGVGAVIARDGEVLLVKRKHEPLRGRWSLPGGAVEVGETLQACLTREMREETGLEIQVGPVVEVLDRITEDEGGRVAYHFVLVDYVCRPVGGSLAPGSDVEEAAFVAPAALPAYELPEEALRVIARALRMAASWPAWQPS